MAHHERIEGLTSADADAMEREWRLLGAVNIRRFDEPGGLVTLTCEFADSPFATGSTGEVTQPVAPAAPSPLPRITAAADFALIAPEYRELFDACVPDPAMSDRVAAHLARMRPGEMRYRALGEKLGIPWRFIAIIHSLECACNFGLHLHNGDPLDARTTRVPEGRPASGEPPFTWEQSAEDALRMKGYVGLADWSLAAMLFRWESYNGMGYRLREMPSPYLWSFSNIYRKGLFIRDHVFDPDAVSRQCGAAVLLKRMQG